MTKAEGDSIIAPVGIDHLAAVQQVMIGAFDPLYGEAWNSAQCLAVLALPGYRLRGAYRGSVENGPMMGFAITRAVADESELLLLAVDPNYRRIGIGSQLLENWLAQSLENTISRAFLEVRDSNPAKKLYEQHGFRCIASRPNYYHGLDGSSHDATTMQKLLS